MENKTPNSSIIMVIQGITRDDLHDVDDIFEMKFMERLEMTEDPLPTATMTKTNTLPEYFTGLATWPKSCNILCWNCFLPFDALPYFIPLDIKLNPLSMSVYGCFCDQHCAQGYILRHYHGYEQENYQRALRFLHNKICGKYEVFIPPAPPCYIQERFCGSGKGIDLNEYREHKKQLLEREGIGKYRLIDYQY